ncbi:hypothetical protein [Azorhizophilus paspali]
MIEDNLNIAELEHDVCCAVLDDQGNPLWVLKRNGGIIICEQSIKNASIQFEQIRT